MANTVRKAILQALGAAPAGQRTKAFVPPLSMFDSMAYGIGGRIKEYRTKPEQLRANLGWVFAANSIVAEACAAAELVLYRIKPDGDKEEVPEHEILDLLDAPNLAYTGEQMRQLHFTYLNLVGESYLLKVKGSGIMDKPSKGQLPDALHILPAQNTEFIVGDGKGSGAFSDSIVKMGADEYPVTALIRDLNPNPEDPYRGRSIITASAATVDTEDQMKEWNRRVFANSARPSLLVEVPEVMEQEPYNRFKQQIEDTTTGTQNAGKPLLLEGGATAKPYMMSQQDLDFLESRKFSKDEILAMFRVSPSMLGMTENVNRANAESAEYTFAKYVVLPRVRQFVSVLNAQLVKPYDKSLELGFKNVVPDDTTAQLEQDKAAINNWMTIDEVRERYGLAALENGNGNVLYIPATSLPITSAGEGLGDTGAGGDGTGDNQNSNAADDTAKKKEHKPNYNPAAEQKALAYTRYARGYERSVMIAVRTQFDSQQQHVLSQIENLQLAKTYYKKGILDDLIDWLLYDSALSKALSPNYFKRYAGNGALGLRRGSRRRRLRPICGADY
jgi:HK97 family phage portal protein